MKFSSDACEFNAAPRLHLDGLVQGLVSTRSKDSMVTDSAAAATALSTGMRTMNHWVGEVSNSFLNGTQIQRPVGTILEAAHAAQKHTGLVTTARLTHATPAAFSSHTSDRSAEELIARQQLAQEIDVLFGGGKKFFQAQDRVDNMNLLGTALSLGYTMVEDTFGLNEASVGIRAPFKVLGLFSRDHMPYAIDTHVSQQMPTLKHMTEAAIHVLTGDHLGFFLMVEGGRIDHAGHANDAPSVIEEVLAFDDAVGTALQYVSSREDVLLIVTADHDTGGMSAACCGALGANHTALSLATKSTESMVQEIHIRAQVLKRALEGTVVTEDLIPIVQAVVGNATRLQPAGMPLPEQVAFDLAAIAAANMGVPAADQTDSVCAVSNSANINNACGELMMRLDGGNALQYALSEWLAHNRYSVGFTSHSHTSVDVMLGAAGGPAANLETRVWENDELGRQLLRLFNVNPEEGLRIAREALANNGIPLV